MAKSVCGCDVCRGKRWIPMIVAPSRAWRRDVKLTFDMLAEWDKLRREDFPPVRVPARFLGR